ncbi:MAG: LysR family transcriptional regulator [Anaerotignum sp.]|nr:LysR family transcriptional regulator [Anaerotignum sp.]
MDMNIQKYLAFLKTVEYGSITKAAEILSYSQSGVSRMIQDIEKEWGLSLLERSRGGVRLTSDGMKLLPRIQSLCTEYEALQKQVQELKGMESGLIRIGTFSSAATHWLPNIIREFQKDYPNIEYELLLGDYTEIETWIQEGRVDCGFLRLPTLPEFDTIFLEQDDFLVILPENHPLTKKEKIFLSDLGKEPFLLLEKDKNTEISDFFRKHDFSPNVHFTLWDDYAILAMVESGMGISLLPRLILKRIPYRVAVRELDVPAYRDIALVLRNQKTAPLAVKRFLEYLSYR